MNQTFDYTAYLTSKYDELEGKFPSTSELVTQKKKTAFSQFQLKGLPTLKNEEWKYTSATSVFKESFILTDIVQETNQKLWAQIIPGTESDNHLFFVNGIFIPTASKITSNSGDIIIKPLYEASQGAELAQVEKYFGCSNELVPDGIHALNTAFAHNGLYLEVKAGKAIENAVYIHFISDSTSANVLSLPRNLFVINQNSEVKVVENFVSLGEKTSLTNIVTEVIVAEKAHFDYYKIQHEGSSANHVGTTHIWQQGKSVANAVTIAMSGGVVRNNLHLVLDAEWAEGNMNGLYLLEGETHVDNHTVADHRKPNGQSNELYKGILDGYSTGVFNGKIFVRQDAQKTNAYQSNKNILLSNHATINTKPQLEIFADDVKCSHGCTTGQLDEEALFYLRSRGISERTAKAMMTKAYVQDILNTVKIPALKEYLELLIENRFDQSI